MTFVKDSIEHYVFLFLIYYEYQVTAYALLSSKHQLE